jgi:hypothetical protein
MHDAMYFGLPVASRTGAAPRDDARRPWGCLGERVYPVPAGVRPRSRDAQHTVGRNAVVGGDLFFVLAKPLTGA